MSNHDIVKYSAYIIGSVALLYSLLFVARYILMFYLILTLKKISKKIPKFDKKTNKPQGVKIHEDEKYRDQKNEIFKQQAAEIQAHLKQDKEQDGGDTIDVDIQKVGANIFAERDTFSEGQTRLEANAMDEVIVGIMPLGRFAGLLGKREREILQSVMRDMTNAKESTKWQDYVAMRKAQSQENQKGL